MATAAVVVVVIVVTFVHSQWYPRRVVKHISRAFTYVGHRFAQYILVADAELTSEPGEFWFCPVNCIYVSLTLSM